MAGVRWQAPGSAPYRVDGGLILCEIKIMQARDDGATHQGRSQQVKGVVAGVVGWVAAAPCHVLILLYQYGVTR